MSPGSLESNHSKTSRLLLDVVIREHVERVIKICVGQQQAAEALGISRTTLHRWIKEWNGSKISEEESQP